MKFLPPVLAAKYDVALDGIHLSTLFRVQSRSTKTTTPNPLFPQGDTSVTALRASLQSIDADLQTRFFAGSPIEQLVRERAQRVDKLVMQAWQLRLSQFGDALALSAVGGYGRGELHPHSDVDLLILLHDPNREPYRHAIEQFIALLWDLGLQASHSVRTIEECLVAARTDVSVATNLMEARYLAGSIRLFSELQAQTQPDWLWPAREFFAAKRKEQLARHAKHHDTAGRLEPNIKESPGGLRDIQTIGWVVKRHFRTDSLHSVVERGFLTDEEYQSLCRGQAFLWRVRFALHLLYGRHEDRLLFDAQPRLATQFGYQDTSQSLAVEQFMQDYYRTVRELELLNEMLLQLLEEALSPESHSAATPLTEEFEECGGFLHQRNPALFSRRPAALLEMFLVLEQHPRLKGVSAETLRSLHANLQRLDKNFRDDSTNRERFMQILREPAGVTHELRRMNRYGVLGRYIPAFGAIVGRMQYDLFHAYTVDEHILFVVSNLRRFILSRYDDEFPLCSQIMQSLPKAELTYLGALFHDIAKGRGGDHSMLGSEEAERFCLEHGLSRYDARLVAWLVQHHLLLSLTAQKKDIHDPQIIQNFARQVGDQTHLDYLYVLTVADVRGTNPELWNSWKASLFSELYRNTSRVLRQGLENPIDKDELIREVHAQALALLREKGMDSASVYAVWSGFTEEYFLRHTADEIAWHTEALQRQPATDNPRVFVRQQTARGGTAVCVQSHQDEAVFGRVTAALAELGLTILDARLISMRDGGRLDTYMVLEDNREPITDVERLAEIGQVLRHEVNRRHAPPMAVTRRAPRQVRLFTTQTEVRFADDPVNRRTVMEISTSDRPGLLSLVGQVLRQCEMRLQNAKITTIGERAEDVFFITDNHNQPLDEAAARDRLRAALLAQLGEAA